MSSGDVTPGKLPWTEDAKFKDDGKTINWSKIKMEGRTTKSLQNMWTKIVKEIAEIEAKDQAGDGHDTPAKSARKPSEARTAAKRRTPTKKRAAEASDKSEASKKVKRSGPDEKGTDSE
ncbi:hypothetical protein CDD80_5733 [Ophiocordyceps camponoti-rufipedis]|uniref:Uncharacterized protein n=1 Tax=Ophiocordyceps camponoti-rufipedis TaxID=2004952 RepID=A0A2C5YMN1_9HYPO|nr:hypothetical protein CDD80_5733 [Ophiocordyceps camponoti-rufipedis]